MTAPLAPVNARVYTRTELDRGVCADCGWPHAVVGVGPKCHPRSPMHARYERASGTIVLLCSVCDTAAAIIQVAWVVPS